MGDAGGARMSEGNPGCFGLGARLGQANWMQTGPPISVTSPVGQRAPVF